MVKYPALRKKQSVREPYRMVTKVCWGRLNANVPECRFVVVARSIRLPQEMFDRVDQASESWSIANKCEGSLGLLCARTRHSLVLFFVLGVKANASLHVDSVFGCWRPPSGNHARSGVNSKISYK